MVIKILMKDVVLEPQEILALYASEAQLERGHTVNFCMTMMMIKIIKTLYGYGDGDDIKMIKTLYVYGDGDDDDGSTTEILLICSFL